MIEVRRLVLQGAIEEYLSGYSTGADLVPIWEVAAHVVLNVGGKHPQRTEDVTYLCRRR